MVACRYGIILLVFVSYRFEYSQRNSIPTRAPVLFSINCIRKVRGRFMNQKLESKNKVIRRCAEFEYNAGDSKLFELLNSLTSPL